MTTIDNSAWLNPTRDEGWPDTAAPLAHDLIGQRVRITVAHKGDITSGADFFSDNPPRHRRNVTVVGRLELIEAGGPVRLRLDDGDADWLPFAHDIEPAPMRWWHWRRLGLYVAAAIACSMPVLIGAIAFWSLWLTGWPAGEAGVGSGLAAAPWAWVGGQLATEASGKARRLR